MFRTSLIKGMGRGFGNGKRFYVSWLYSKGNGKGLRKETLGLDLRPLKACYGHDRV